ncbi:MULTISPECIES: autotransporter outer membrane beta-barrel domain-containing protein [unclassified Devosia]|uniref:autotransporter outer membrane beta-barrel domain-containing protein n=1 Tax=unclassified Devosia TaxID=196773 RepID=UPI00145F6D88|nr:MULTISPECIES: autotransporter outer membrane beta-barrel domain-containing protein [unclassified Devosia]MBJ6988172.1 autotransporter outer membrane beta-barrel domain-containing protein [Devosia sp. MC521]QMW63453.1 autotransporter outer membrane beta-barrel domain-containing protein [Devosia sp. MC521]
MHFTRLAFATLLASSAIIGTAHAVIPTSATVTLNSGSCATGQISLAVSAELGALNSDYSIYLVDSSNKILRSIDDTAQYQSTKWVAFYLQAPFSTAPLTLYLQDRTTEKTRYSMGQTLPTSLSTMETLNTFTLSALDSTCAVEEAGFGARQQAKQSYLTDRINLLGNSIRPTGQRISRLNGQRTGSDMNGGDVLNYVSSFAATGSLPVSASLSAIADVDQSGEMRTSPYDVWLEGTFSLLEAGGQNGRATSAAIGADYLLTPDLLVGGFVSIDRLDNFETATDTFSGTGWMAGPYLTTRLTDQLYLDLTAGAGTAANKKSNSSGEDNFNSTRAYLNATLEGQFGEEAIRFTPRLGLNYAGEWAAGYTDHNGAWTDATSSTSGSVFAGPGVTFTAHDSDITRSLTLRADANTTLGDGAQLTAALEAAVQLGFANGVDLSARANWAGIGTSAKTLSLSLKASAGF